MNIIYFKRRNAMFTKLSYVLMLVLILTGSLFAQGTDPGTTNLKHSWTFNDGTANDYVGGANGTLMGAAVIDGGSLLTIAPSQWMEMPGDLIVMSDYDEVTIEAWFISVAGANTNYHMLVYFGDTVGGAGANGYFITPARGDDKSRAAISCGVTVNPWSGESGANGPEYDDGSLHHMVSTLDASNITLYIDGELMASTPLAANNFISGISSNFAYLAKSGYDGDATWRGEILEFNIYNRALTADEILFLSLKDPSSAVDEGKTTTRPTDHCLSQNFPNPFNPTTTISFGLKNSSKVDLKVYDINGCEIVTLINEVKSAGQYSVPFDGSNLCSGVYMYKMVVDNNVYMKKMLLLK
jgi:hypothetical protein